MIEKHQGEERNKVAASLGRKSVLWKLVRVFFFVSFVGAILHFFIFLGIHQLFFERLDQILHWNAAKEYARILSPNLSPEFQRAEIDRKIFDFRRLNPAFDIYLLNDKGQVFYTEYYSVQPSVPLEPILSFLSQKGFPLLPIKGRDPRNLGKERYVPFSVARVTISGHPGYLYVLLRGEDYRMAYQTFGDLTISGLSAVFLFAMVVLTSVLGALVFRYTLKRFRDLTHAIERFTSGRYETRVEGIEDDEIGLHASAFNEMAQTIESNIAILEEQDTLRRELVAGVSHDLRSPVGAMLSLLETFKSEYNELDAQDRELYLERAYANCRDLKSLVDDLFELSKLDAKAQTPQFEPVELKPMFRRIINKYIDESQQKDLGITVKIEPGLSSVCADSNMLNRVLSNLFENAVRYCPSGGDVELKAENSPDNMALISVKDSGVGIAEEELEHVFDKFYRGSRGKEIRSSGTGLGLAIAKKIVDLHGGSISVKSCVGQGTEFFFTVKKGDD